MASKCFSCTNGKLCQYELIKTRSKQGIRIKVEVSFVQHDIDSTFSDSKQRLLSFRLSEQSSIRNFRCSNVADNSSGVIVSALYFIELRPDHQSYLHIIWISDINSGSEKKAIEHRIKQCTDIHNSSVYTTEGPGLCYTHVNSLHIIYVSKSFDTDVCSIQMKAYQGICESNGDITELCTHRSDQTHVIYCSVVGDEEFIIFVKKTSTNITMTEDDPFSQSDSHGIHAMLVKYNIGQVIPLDVNQFVPILYQDIILAIDPLYLKQFDSNKYENKLIMCTSYHQILMCYNGCVISCLPYDHEMINMQLFFDGSETSLFASHILLHTTKQIMVVGINEGNLEVCILYFLIIRYV